MKERASGRCVLLGIATTLAVETMAASGALHASSVSASGKQATPSRPADSTRLRRLDDGQAPRRSLGADKRLNVQAPEGAWSDDGNVPHLHERLLLAPG